ncbi:hypothetical protein IQ07DRAFT_640588 [Pyrenochaeta sp. DS3sAY3a]|nr:hypothetical protein IQ07DRAFT_640588 [Pyrenochaeta sp. DS3sAY3a]
MSQLEMAPQPVIREILRNLLLAPRVVQPPNHLFIEHYDFEVDVRLVSTTIKRHADAVLYGENQFVKLICNFKDIKRAMYNHEVPFFNLPDTRGARRGAFAYPTAEVTVSISTFNQRMKSFRLKKPLQFLILLEDMPKFTRILRILDLANFMGYEFQFNLPRPHLPAVMLSVDKQAELLAPFEQLRGGAMVQRVAFTGAFDQELVKNVREVMTQKVAWLRAGIWEVYNIALSIKRVGDRAFRHRNADMAIAKYQDMKTFIESALTANYMMRDVDIEAEKALTTLIKTTYVDIALLTLTNFTAKEVGRPIAYQTVVNLKGHIDLVELEKNEPEKGTIIPAKVLARFYFLLGLAELGLDHPVKAGKALARSYRLHATSITRDAYDVADQWHELDRNTQKSRFRAALATRPKTLLPLPDMKVYETPEVASEQWVMRELGYKGKFQYEDLIKGCVKICLTEEPHRHHHYDGPRVIRIGEVLPDVLRHHVNRYRSQMGLPVAQGKLVGCVGLSIDAIGEDTPLNHVGEGTNCNPM